MLFKEDAAARAQVKAVRENVGWYRWTHDQVTLSGPDAARFLDYMLVNDMASLAVGRSRYTCMLDDEGKIIDDLIAMRVGEDTFWLSTLYGPHMVKHFDAHKGDFDVTYEDTTQAQDMYAIQGPNSAAMMDALIDASVADMKRFSLLAAKVGDIEVTVHRSGFTGENGYEIYCTRDDSAAVYAAIEAAAAKFDAPRLDILEVYVRSIPMEKGFGLRQDYYKLSPYECGFDWQIRDKDFVGKEAMEAYHDEGEKLAFVGFELDPARESYEDIAQGEGVFVRGVRVGKATQFIYGYTVDKNIGFGVVRADRVKIGDTVKIGPNDAKALVVEPKWC
ncbi:MAG: aminomethyltransferase family protein [Coriobacteriaceae bacterium]|nr:aminomethyltransferase family protein [Coriobacteriaceae bacterium]